MRTAIDGTQQCEAQIANNSQHCVTEILGDNLLVACECTPYRKNLSRRIINKHGRLSFWRQKTYRGVGVAVVVRKTRVTFRPMVMGELENRFPGPSHPGVCLGRIRSGQSGYFLRGQGLKKVQAKAVKMKLTHLRREARKKVAIVQRGVVGENGRNYVL